MRRNNLISDLYVSNIRQFKPVPINQKEIESAVQSFKLPQAPSLPTDEISTASLGEYEASEVETESTPAASATTTQSNEDWFVFEEAEEHH